MTDEKQANNYYIIGFKNLNENDSETALQVFNKALKLFPNNEDYKIGVLLAKNFIKLTENEQYKGDVYSNLDKIKAQIYQIQLKKLHNKNKDKISSFNKGLISKNDFSDDEISEIELMKKLDFQNTDYNRILSVRKYYESGMKYFTQNDIEKALYEFNKAFELYPQNNECQQMINFAKYKLNDPSIFYKNGLIELKNNNYDEAVKMFEKALSIKELDSYKEGLTAAKSKKINIMEASKNILLTINCFNETKVDEIIKSREEGQVWYDLDSFVSTFNIQPHEILDLQDIIEFPSKPKNTVSRRIEF